MIVTSLWLLIGLAAAAPANDSSSVLSTTAVWHEGKYNASGNFTLLTHPLNPGNALYSEPMVNWTVEERIAAAPGSSSTWTYCGVRPVEALPANILPGWSLCVTLIPTKRTSSDPVDGTCKGIVSDECISSLKAGSSRCNSGATLKGCPADGSYSFREWKLPLDLFPSYLVRTANVNLVYSNAVAGERDRCRCAGWLEAGNVRWQRPRKVADPAIRRVCSDELYCHTGIRQ